MQLPPIDVISSWPAPNYKDPETRGPANLIINVVCFVLVCLVISLRIYTRVRLSKTFGADDWLILLAMIPTTAFAITSLVAEIGIGWNRHIWDVKPGTMTTALKMVMLLEVLFSLATTFTKLSMLILIFRLIATVSTKTSRLIVIVMVICIAELLIFCLSEIFQCGLPSKAVALSFKPQPECISHPKNLLAHGIINIITDFVVVIIPMPKVWNLQLPLRQQILLALLFSGGLLVSIAGVIRVIYAYKVTSVWDKSWMSFPVWVASGIELYLGIICASVPPTKMFFTRYVPKIVGRSLGSNGTARMNLQDKEFNLGVFSLQIKASGEGQFSEAQARARSTSIDSM